MLFQWALEHGLSYFTPMDQPFCFLCGGFHHSGETHWKLLRTRLLLGVHTALEAMELIPRSPGQARCDSRADGAWRLAPHPWVEGGRSTAGCARFATGGALATSRQDCRCVSRPACANFWEPTGSTSGLHPLCDLAIACRSVGHSADSRLLHRPGQGAPTCYGCCCSLRQATFPSPRTPL